MAMIRKCDFGDCGNEGVASLDMRHGTIGYRADLCTDHVSVMMETVTFQPTMSDTYGKRRDVYTGASGQPFSAADARAWLIEEGIRPAGAGTGRVAKEHLELYASKH